MSTPSLPQIRVALFGQAAAGKTALLASYYGTLQHSDATRPFSLLATRAAQGSLLLGNYHQMEGGHFPPSTADAEEYVFDLTVEGMKTPALTVHILDYPGGWWTQDADDPELEDRRQQILQRLTLSQAGFLIVDGAAYKEKGAGYLRQLFDSFRQEIVRIDRLAKPDAVDAATSLPPTWIVALSKADLFGPDFSAEAFSKRVIQDAGQQLQHLANALGSNELGSRFLLLSAARGEGTRVLDLNQQQGLALIAPLAFKVAIEHSATAAPAEGGFERLLKALRNIVSQVDKLDDILPARFQLLTRLIGALKLEDLLDTRIETLQEGRKQAVAQNDAKRAAALALAEQFHSEAAAVAYHDNQPNRRA